MSGWNKKILWVLNAPLPGVLEQLGMQDNHKEGWLVGLYGAVCKYNPELAGQISIAFPISEERLKQDITNSENPRKYTCYTMGNTVCYGFSENTAQPETCDESLIEVMGELLDEVNPDLVHIFGTEYWHATAMALAAKNRVPALVGLQGIMDACTKHYMCYLTDKEISHRTFRDWLKHDSLEQQQAKFRIRAGFERRTLENVDYVAGRTSFDADEANKINRDLTYKHLGEVLRQEFYESGDKNVKPGSIFLSQGNYPLKGAHMVLDALPLVLKEYPNATVTIAGDNLTRSKTLKEKIKLSGYGRILKRKIRKNGLEGKVIFTGSIGPLEMKEQYLAAEVFVCPSSVENSPNSVGEAMLQKTPVVAARTGGIPDVICPDSEALFYTPNDVQELAKCIIDVMSNPKETAERVERAYEHACRNHDARSIVKELQDIYTQCMA